MSQVKREFNGFGQMTVEFQAVDGAVNGNTSKVQYAYSEAAGGVNHSRLVNMTYPDGRVNAYNYGAANSTNDRVSRLANITSGNTTLEGYSYLGLSTVVVRSHPSTGTELSYLLRVPEAFGDAGDQYNGLDRFGRVVDQRWMASGNGATLDRYQYGYDQNSNRLWRDNLSNTTFGEIYSYDNLAQLTSFDRGTLNGNHTGLTGNATRSQLWDLDPLGNWNGVTTDGTSEGRTHNAQNQVTGVGNSTLTFDSAGNMLTDETGQTYTYDSWNKLVSVSSGNATIVDYGYDALGRRVLETHGNATSELYYSSQWQVLEERDAASGNATMQYAWSPVYVNAMIERDRDTDGNGSLDERLWVQQDANWNVTSIVDGSGVVQERYAYTAYGVRMVLDAGWSVKGGGSDKQWIYGWQSLRQDLVTTLYSTWTRWVSPTLGRPINSDPLGLGPDVNPYRWEYGSPLSFIDPSGLQPNYRPKPLGSPIPNYTPGANLGMTGQIPSDLPYVYRPPQSPKLPTFSQQQSASFMKALRKNEVPQCYIDAILKAINTTPPIDMSTFSIGAHQKCFEWIVRFERNLNAELAKLNKDPTSTQIPGITAHNKVIFEVPWNAQGNGLTEQWSILRPLTSLAMVLIPFGDIIGDGYYIGATKKDPPPGGHMMISNYLWGQDHTVYEIKFNDNDTWYIDSGMIQKVLAGGNINSLTGQDNFTHKNSLPKGWIRTDREGDASDVK